MSIQSSEEERSGWTEREGGGERPWSKSCDAAPTTEYSSQKEKGDQSIYSENSQQVYQEPGPVRRSLKNTKSFLFLKIFTGNLKSNSH